ncbi:MAG: NAD(P)-binding protein [Coraliomargaritaceae bacterium]
MREISIVIFGSGFFGSTIARVLAQFGLKVLILERRNHIGGNAWSEQYAETGIDVDKYGSHIFHTDNEKVWKFINQFTEFNEYRHSVWTTYEDQVYSMPINLNTINSFYNRSVCGKS